MTAFTISRRDMPLDDLVVRVYHLELKECRDEAEFKEGVRLILRNLDEVMETLCGYRAPGPQDSPGGGPRENEGRILAYLLRGHSRVF
jgi:hypothetical protein